MVTACTYKSITLDTGESYVLPAGAELVYVSGEVTSTCVDIPEAASACYGFNLTVDGSNFVGSGEDYRVTGFYLDDVFIEINPNYGTFGTDIAGVGFETGSNFVNRLASNIWDQLALVANGSIIQGLRVELDNSGDDVILVTINIPQVFTSIRLEVTDTDSSGSLGSPKFYFDGTLNEDCTALSGVDYTSNKGNLV